MKTFRLGDLETIALLGRSARGAKSSARERRPRSWLGAARATTNSNFPDFALRKNGNNSAIPGNVRHFLAGKICKMLLSTVATDFLIHSISFSGLSCHLHCWIESNSTLTVNYTDNSAHPVSYFIQFFCNLPANIELGEWDVHKEPKQPIQPFSWDESSHDPDGKKIMREFPRQLKNEHLPETSKSKTSYKIQFYTSKEDHNFLNTVKIPQKNPADVFLLPCTYQNTTKGYFPRH